MHTNVIGKVSEILSLSLKQRHRMFQRGFSNFKLNYKTQSNGFHLNTTTAGPTGLPLVLHAQLPSIDQALELLTSAVFHSRRQTPSITVSMSAKCRLACPGIRRRSQARVSVREREREDRGGTSCCCAFVLALKTNEVPPPGRNKKNTE